MSLTGNQAKEFYIDRWKRNLGYLSELRDGKILVLNNHRFKSINTQISKLDKNLIRYGDEELSVSDLKKLDELNDRVSKYVVDDSGIQFVDREVQIKKFTGEEQIRSNERIRFVLLEAPPRYGKSYLLSMIKEIQRYKEWVTIKYAFREHRDTAENLDGFLKKLMILIIGAKSREPLRENEVEKIYHNLEKNSVKQLVTKVIGALSDLSTRINLFFDDAEIVNADVRDCIRGQLFPGLKNVVDENLNQQMLCIVAGRYITTDWKEKNEFDNKFENEIIPLHPEIWEDEFLKPLRTEHILRALGGLLDKCNLSNGDVKREEFAQIVNMISSGHPESVVSSLLFIASETLFSYDPNYWKKRGNRETLFNNCVKPLSELVLHNDDDMAEIFKSICCFRRYDNEIVSKINAEYESKTLLNLKKFGLIYQDEDDDLFYKDDRIRRILAFEKWTFSKKQAAELNQIAQKYFENIFKNPYDDDIDELDHYRIVMAEYIFHSIMMLSHDSKASDDKSRKLYNLLTESLTIYQKNWQKKLKHIRNKNLETEKWESEKKRILRVLKKDDELSLQSIHILKSEKKFLEMLFKVFG